jgi:hypothetical protein
MRIGDCLRKLHYSAALICSSRLLFVASELVLSRPQPKSCIGQEPKRVEASFHATLFRSSGALATMSAPWHVLYSPGLC